MAILLFPFLKCFPYNSLNRLYFLIFLKCRPYLISTEMFSPSGNPLSLAEVPTLAKSLRKNFTSFEPALKLLFTSNLFMRISHPSGLALMRNKSIICISNFYPFFLRSFYFLPVLLNFLKNQLYLQFVISCPITS